MNIDGFLASNGVRRISGPGDPESAWTSLETSRYLARHFGAFNRIRTALAHPEHHSPHELDEECQKVVDWLVDRNWLARTGQTVRFHDERRQSARSYLNGDWLESYVWCACMEAGADEAYFRQKVEWRVDDVTGVNEIDVIARKCNQVIFVSCKAISPDPVIGRSAELRQFLLEAHYWNLHFAKGQAVSGVVTTADLINEEVAGGQNRFPPIHKQAGILDVELLGAEDLRWRNLVAGIRKWVG